MASGAIFNLTQACSRLTLGKTKCQQARLSMFCCHLQHQHHLPINIVFVSMWSISNLLFILIVAWYPTQAQTKMKQYSKRLKLPASIFFLFYKPWNRTVSFMCRQLIQLIVLRFNLWNVLSTMITSVPPTYFLPHCSTLTMCLVFVDKARTGSNNQQRFFIMSALAVLLFVWMLIN